MSRAAKPTLQQKPMACVSINHEGFLLPFADAQKLAEIMTRAVHCRERYDGGLKSKFLVEGPPQISLEVVMPDQVRMPEPAPDEPAAPRRSTAALPGQPRLAGPEGKP